MLADLLTAWAEFLGDRLVNVCGQDAPDRVLRYHGGPPPDDAGCDNVLSVWWDPPLTLTGTSREQPCGGPLTATIGARWTRCWKIPEASKSGLIRDDVRWDADAAILADVAECVASEIVGLQCAPKTGNADPFVQAVLDRIASLSFAGANPYGPGGGSAGVLWRATVKIRATSRSEAS